MLQCFETEGSDYIFEWRDMRWEGRGPDRDRYG